MNHEVNVNLDKSFYKHISN